MTSATVFGSGGELPDVSVDYLADHRQFIEILAGWHHETWSYLSPSTTLAQRVERLRGNAHKSRIPTTFVALLAGRPVGCASLVSSDLSIRQNLSPWLASVYVEPALRNKGVGSRLVVRAMQEANRLGHNDLYLFTPDRQTFYARLGWREIEKCLYRNYPMSVMQYEFAKLSDLLAPA